MVKGFEITTAEQVTEALFKHRDTYNDKGMYLGFEKLHELYSMTLGNCTDWSGLPMSGKTQVLMECLVNTSKYYGWKHLVYFPDVGNNIEIMADLIHKKTGKTFQPGRDNTITDSEITKGAMWVANFFKILTKKDIKAKMTPIEFWDLAVQLKKSEGLHTASIDSWKDMHHKYGDHGGYAQYLEFVLPYRNQIAEDNDLHLHTIIHPKETEKDGKTGKRLPPRPYDLKGGSEWFNSGKCMITVHRYDITTNVVTIMVNKVKPRAIGKVGEVEMFFDMNTFTYYENEQQGNTFIRKYAAPREQKNEFITEIKPLNPSMSSFGGYQQQSIEGFELNSTDEDCPF